MVNYLSIPKSTIEALLRYLEDGIAPGSFLTAVLENDLSGAIRHADSFNLAALPSLVSLIHSHIPAGAWGSPQHVDQWLSRPLEVDNLDFIRGLL